MALCKFVFFTAVLTAALNLTFAGINNEEILKYAEQAVHVYTACSKEHNLTPVLAVKILNSVMNYDPLPEGPGVKCYIACHLEGTGMAKDGAILWDNILELDKKIYPDEDNKKIMQTIETCRKSEKPGGAACEVEYESAKCYYGNLKKLKVTPIKTDLRMFGAP